MTLTPAYGRDYKTAKEAKAAWEAGQDFIVANAFSQWDGKPANKASFPKGETVTLRFCGLRKVCSVKGAGE